MSPCQDLLLWGGKLVNGAVTSDDGLLLLPVHDSRQYIDGRGMLCTTVWLTIEGREYRGECRGNDGKVRIKPVKQDSGRKIV